MMPTRRVPVLVAVVLSVLVCHSGALAQLLPERLYYGINRAMPMVVGAPAGTAEGATIEVRLYAPGAAEPAHAAACKAGRVDLAELFPHLWTAPEPALWYAQLAVDGKGVGAPVVLQPMVTPPRPALDNRNGNLPLVVYPPALQAEKKVYSGVRAYVDRHIVLDTSEGELRIVLRPEAAPNTAFIIRELAAGGFYTDTVFHRVVPVGRGGKGFVVQGGDPTGTGDGTPGFEYPLEPSTLPHDFGVVSIARDKEPTTNGCQFFICLSREETARLDGLYCAFGQVLEGGAEVIARIARTPLKEGSKEQPVKPPAIRRAYLVDAPPYGTGPKPVRLPASGGER